MSCMKEFKRISLNFVTLRTSTAEGSNEVKPEEVLVQNPLQGKDMDIREGEKVFPRNISAMAM